MSKIVLTVDNRDKTGKGPARRLRAAGKVPAIFYGKKTEPIKIAVDNHEFRKAVEQAGTNPLFDLQITEKGEVSTRRALLKDRQTRPWDGTLVHLDFLEVFMDESIQVTVPLEFEGKPAGLDKGGMFHVASRELVISCLPDDIPDVIKVDVSGLDIGDSVHVGAITLPKGVVALEDAGVALATLAAPKKEEEAEAEAPTEEAEAGGKTETS
ncbi:MAG: 50S ribosomal protein L25 [Desulfomonile tiedjei]|nr:50S ribosomal protein L25 [Desulfomonile tiedjei]